MSKQECRAKIEAHVTANPQTVVRLPPGRNGSFEAWLLQSYRRAHQNRKANSVRSSRSLWFVRGEGTV